MSQVFLKVYLTGSLVVSDQCTSVLQQLVTRPVWLIKTLLTQHKLHTLNIYDRTKKTTDATHFAKTLEIITW